MFRLPRPQPQLQRLGNSRIFVTPNTPADPRDCSRFPNSPFCGGSGFNLSSTGFFIEIVADQCNLGIQISPRFAFVSLPSFQIVYRFSSCINSPPPQTVLIDGELIGRPVAKCADGSSWIMMWDAPAGITVVEGAAQLISESKAAGQQRLQEFISQGLNDATLVYEERQTSASNKAIYPIWCHRVDRDNNFLEARQFQVSARIMSVVIYSSFFTGSGWVLVASFSFDFDFPASPCPPPAFPPPIPRKKPDMNCCAETLRLLRLILQKIGSTDLPASVPNSLTQKNSGTTQIQNLAQFIAYSIKQTNNQFGQFPQEIKIQDADLTQEGDQSQTVTLPNLAESIAEIVGMLLILQSESNATLIAAVNSMVEAGSSKQNAFLAYEYAKANAEYLAYKGKQVERKLPFTFKPGEAQLDKMLKEGEVSVKGWENDDKDDLNDALAPLLEMAAMYRVQNFRNLGTGDIYTVLKNTLTNAINLSKGVDNLVNTPPPQTDPEAPPPQPKKGEWDQFLEQAEQGFISQPGITDSTQPYSRPLDQRPRIREIGNDTSDTNQGNP